MSVTVTLRLPHFAPLCPMNGIKLSCRTSKFGNVVVGRNTILTPDSPVDRSSGNSDRDPIEEPLMKECSDPDIEERSDTIIEERSHPIIEERSDPVIDLVSDSLFGLHYAFCVTVLNSVNLVNSFGAGIALDANYCFT